MRKKSGILVALVASIVLCLSSAAFAGVYWETEVVSKGLPGQPDGARIEKHYMTEKASRVEMGNGNVIITNFDTMTTYHLNTGAKTYMEMKMQDLDRAAKMPPGMQDKMKGGMQVTPTSEKKTIEGYPCTKYDVSFMQMKGEYWVSKEVKGYEELKTIGKKVAAAWEKSPLMRQMNTVSLINNMDGFPVQTVMHIMNGQSTSTLKKVEEKDFSNDLFTVPSGYKKMDMGQMGRPQG